MTREWQRDGTCECGATVYVARDGTLGVAYTCFCEAMRRMGSAQEREAERAALEAWSEHLAIGEAYEDQMRAEERAAQLTLIGATDD